MNTILAPSRHAVPRPPVRRPPPEQRDAHAQQVLFQAPRPWSFWRIPRRFVRSRLRMMRGAPLSTRWSLDRGQPAHRYYITLFLREYCGDICGRCLEFDGRDYLDHFGQHDVTHGDVLNLDDSNPRATVVADITRPNDIPSNHYDCIVCTHVLHMIPDVPAAIRGMHRILKPGGVLLCAVPHVSWCDEREGELWRFTRLGLHTLMTRAFDEASVLTRAYGNSLVAAGEMRGLTADEFTWRELHEHDHRSAVEICSRAVKSR